MSPAPGEEPRPSRVVGPGVDTGSAASTLARASGPRGDGHGRDWPIGPIAVASVVIIIGAAIAVGLFVPRRAERWVAPPLRSVRVSNAFGSHCQLENGTARPLPYTCGSSLGPHPHLAADAPRRPWVVIRSQHDNCVLDVDTLEAVLCHDTMIEWALLERGRLSISVLDPRGRGQLVVQKDLASGQLRELHLPHSTWMSPTADPSMPLLFFDERSRPHRLGWGELEPVEPRQ